jgi:sporulation protein YqfC
LKEKRSILQQVLDSAGLEEEGVPGQSVIELLGDSRALIENHRQVVGYDLSQICIRVSFGTVQIFGCNLRLRAITGQKLLITGKIDRIDICRG